MLWFQWDFIARDTADFAILMKRNLCNRRGAERLASIKMPAPAATIVTAADGPWNSTPATLLGNVRAIDRFRAARRAAPNQ